MKSFTILLTTIVFLTLSTNAKPADLEKAELINQYFEIMDINGIAISYMNAYFKETRRLYPDIDNNIWLHDDIYHLKAEYIESLINGWKSIYHEELSMPELKELIEFLETPIGKKFLTLDKKLRPKFDAVSNSLGSQLNDKVIEALSK